MGITEMAVCSTVFHVVKLEHSHKSRASLLMDGVSCFIGISLQCHVVVPVGSHLVFLLQMLHVLQLFSFPLSIPDCDSFGEAASLCAPCGVTLALAS